MGSNYFQSYTRNLQRVFYAELVENLQTVDGSGTGVRRKSGQCAQMGQANPGKSRLAGFERLPFPVRRTASMAAAAAA